jgi:hypothetical protein
MAALDTATVTTDGNNSDPDDGTTLHRCMGEENNVPSKMVAWETPPAPTPGGDNEGRGCGRRRLQLHPHSARRGIMSSSCSIQSTVP